jgi:hypothetical protein
MTCRKMITVFDKPTVADAKCYSPTEHLSVEVSMLSFEGLLRGLKI